MRGLRFVLTAVAGACAFPDVSRLEGGDAASDAASDVTSDVTGDVMSDTGADVLDAGAASDAAWTFVSTHGNFYDDGGVKSVSVTSSAAAGDLVIAACDSEGKANDISLDGTTAGLLPHKLGPFVNSDGSLETVLYWGVLATTPGNFTMTATPSVTVGFLDCSIDVYAGGTPSAHEVAHLHTSGLSGNSTCGPVSTVTGGVAFYIDVAYTCAGTPNAPWTQRQDLEGNPTGDIVPTTGASVQANLATCGSGNQWDCLTVALTP